MFTDWETVGVFLGILASALAVLRGLWKLAPVLHRKLRKMFGVEDLKTDLAAMQNQLQFVVDELRPNGGASIRDSLNRIEIRQVLHEQRQKAILSDMTVGVFETDVKGNFVWVNRKYLRMTGRAPGEVKGTGWVNTVADRDRERVVNEWNAAIAEQREFEAEFMMLTPDNERLCVHMRTYKMSDPDNPQSNLGFMGMVTPSENPNLCN